MVRKSIFKDPKLQSQYLQQGYLVVPALDQHQVAEMMQLHDLTHLPSAELPNCYNTSDHVASIETKREIKHNISKVLHSLYSNYLNGFKPVYANFIGKKPSQNSNRELHQDYCFSNEDVFDSYNVWIPLQNITETNSYFSIVRNSYQFFHSYRGRYLRHRFDPISDQIIERLCTNIYPKAGHALIYNTGSLHYTPDNTSDQLRVAISVMTIPEEAEIQLYQSSVEMKGHAERFKVDEEFLLSYPAWQRIEGMKADELIRYDDSDISWQQFKRAYYKYNPDALENGFFKRLLQRL